MIQIIFTEELKKEIVLAVLDTLDEKTATIKQANIKIKETLIAMEVLYNSNISITPTSILRHLQI